MSYTPKTNQINLLQKLYNNYDDLRLKIQLFIKIIVITNIDDPVLISLKSAVFSHFIFISVCFYVNYFIFSVFLIADLA